MDGVFPILLLKKIPGLSGAMLNTFGNITGILTPNIIGYIVEGTGSFNGAVLYVGANALIAIFCYIFVVGDITRFELQKTLKKIYKK